MAPRPATATLRQAVSSCSARAAPAAHRPFSTSQCHNEVSKQRRTMFEWLNKLERDLGRNRGIPQYVGGPDQPFPHNPLFRSQSVLDEEAREMIWRRVTKGGEPLKVVSADLGVDVRRVAAVVRLKQIEKRWVKEGKKLATPYSKAILSMLPRTSYSGPEKPTHEPINDIHVHGYTMQQLFLPTSESRHFTRHDAAKAFHDKMLPAEERSAHPELIEMTREVLKGKGKRESQAAFVQAAAKSEKAMARQVEESAKRAEANTVRVDSDRFQFRIQAFNSEKVGPDGRNRHAVGWRYGAPLQDRKRGMVKIPTKVP